MAKDAAVDRAMNPGNMKAGTRCWSAVRLSGSRSPPISGASRPWQEGDVITEQGEDGDELFLLLDGVLAVEIDGAPVAEVGPGSVLGERAIIEGGVRTSTLRA